MPSEKAEVGTWIDELDGPERLERAKKKRSEQLKRWERRESNGSACSEPKRARRHNKNIEFKPNVVILEAAARNDLDEVARLLESGVSPDLANEDGLTALHQSCIDGCDDMVKYLVEHKANVNACDNELWTPLHAAAACGHMSIVKYLLNNGGNILALNLDGNFPVDVIEDNEKVVQFLEQKMNDMGFDEDAKEGLRQNQGKQLLDDLKDSLENKRSLDIQDENGTTAFHIAAANGWTTVLDFLLENEADFEIADNDGWQPIHAAAAWGHDTILEVLVASGADLDSKTNDSKTPIDLTEEDEIIELIEELKTKEVKYPRKGKGVRRRRSNTSNSSIKRLSIHEKSELSHADIKAEGAAMLIQLQNTGESEVNTPEEQTTPQQTLDSHFGERTSNCSRDETSSSGYVSEASCTETKTEEKAEKNDQRKHTSNAVTKGKLDVTNYLITNELDKTKNTEETSANKTKPTNNKTPPIPKPPRLTTTTSSHKEPSAYINVDIEPIPIPHEKIPADKQKDTGTPDIKMATEKTTAKNELNKNAEAKIDPDNNSTPSLPGLAPTEKKKAPEPPQPAVSKKEKTSTPKSEGLDKASKKANRSSKRSSESSHKKSCIIL